MPCIVILVHGVNDVGEAYQNQDTGICRGLNTRLGRKDFQPHTWQPEQFMISDVEGKVANSPVIPFYWGYKPVDHSAWVEDQKLYTQAVNNLKNAGKKNDADLPYDTYQEFKEENIAAHAGEHIDNLNNWLDKQHANARGGGTFANATTSIPDIFGPGANGLSVWMVGEASRSWLNGGDWTHPVYSNPHRIYIAYAARRLADLILKIRRDSGAKNDTINIVAHSQGTIITMLANMWVKAEKQNPADCVILCHSPYSLENRWQENGQPGNQQTDDARQQTLAHFCNTMKKNKLHDGGTSHNADYISQLHDNNCLTDEGQTAWVTETYNRNNFGLVYNYFCPEDQVVSMMPIQGMGWRGIPDPLSRSMGDNIRQRVFCKDEAVGDKTGYRYIAKDIRKLDRNRVPVPEPKIKDPDKPVQDVIYLYNDVIINAPLLPTSFNFTLNGQDNNYRSAIGGNDVNISRAAMMAEAFVEEVIDIPNTPEFHALPLYQFLNNEQLSEVSALHNIVAISGQKVDVYDGDYYARHEKLKIQRRMKEDEIEAALLKGTTYSQHSSIVSNDDVPEKAMTYDLAIGQCKAYEQTEFWRDLLLQADWRWPDNPDTYTRRYYSEGKLPEEFKKMMNKPETGEKPMPTGENGVVNDYGPRRETDWRNGEWVSVTQWVQPDPVPPELL
ncbi:T6SS effector phospholipase Tle3 domain-containing protein [Citrobacter farmeri]|nr:DUF3274 domain-containing protein [Citrobacter farmeri]